MIFRAFGVAAILPLLDLHCGGNKDNEQELKLCKDKLDKLEKDAKPGVKPGVKPKPVNKSCNTLTAENTKLTAENTKLTDANKTLTDDKQALSAQNQKLTAANQAKCPTTVDLTAQLTTANNANTDLTNQNTDLTNQLTKAKDEKDQAIREKEAAKQDLEEHLKKSFLDTVQDKAIDSLEETIDNLVAAIKMILNETNNGIKDFTFNDGNSLVAIFVKPLFTEFKNTVEQAMQELAKDLKNKSSDKLTATESVITKFVNKIWNQMKDIFSNLISTVGNAQPNVLLATKKFVIKALEHVFGFVFKSQFNTRLTNGTQFIKWWNLLTASVTGTCEQVKDANACTAKNGAHIKQCMVDDKNTGNCFVPLPTCGDSTLLSTTVLHANLDTGISKKNDETTEFTCKEGYTPVNNTLTCNTDEETPKWTIQDGAVCQEKTCGDSTTLSTQVDNAKVPSNISVKHNGTISFTCLSGKPQNAQLTCNTAVDTPEWTVQDGAVCQGPETVDEEVEPETVCTGTNAIAANNGDALVCNDTYRPVESDIKCFQAVEADSSTQTETLAIAQGWFVENDHSGEPLENVCIPVGEIGDTNEPVGGGEVGEEEQNGNDSLAFFDEAEYEEDDDEEDDDEEDDFEDNEEPEVVDAKDKCKKNDQNADWTQTADSNVFSVTCNANYRFINGQETMVLSWRTGDNYWEHGEDHVRCESNPLCEEIPEIPDNVIETNERRLQIDTE